MPAARILPTSDVLRKHREAGWSYQRIADHYGVSKGAVYLQLRDAGLAKARPSYKHLIPWTVRQEHAHAFPVLMLRTLGKRDAGGDVPEVKLGMLNRWLDEIKAADVVVCYKRDMPPNPASPSTGGFYYSRRRPDDDPKSLIRYEEDEPAKATDGEAKRATKA
ncbi:hypothetical protein ACFCZT_07920 [Streptomyces sp. NPDC056230]|uniref:hypothetical protein n=1 Tax=Streptomyces sp. NPDC056230 TaxID=3345754 RepID=UPI0035DE1F0C